MEVRPPPSLKWRMRWSSLTNSAGVLSLGPGIGFKASGRALSRGDDSAGAPEDPPVSAWPANSPAPCVLAGEGLFNQLALHGRLVAVAPPRFTFSVSSRGTPRLVESLGSDAMSHSAKWGLASVGQLSGRVAVPGLRASRGDEASRPGPEVGPPCDGGTLRCAALAEANFPLSHLEFLLP